MKKNFRSLIASILAVTMIFALAACGKAAAPAAGGNAGGAGTEVKASVPGSILRVNVKAGDSVAKGDELLVMDVMKMEQPVTSPCDGTVQSVSVAQTDKVNTGDVLVVIG